MDSKKTKFKQKVISFLATLNLVLQSFLIFIPVNVALAQELTPTPAPEVQEVQEIQPTVIPPEPTVIPEVSPAEVSPTIVLEPTLEPTIFQEMILAPTEIPVPAEVPVVVVEETSQEKGTDEIVPTPTPIPAEIEKICLTDEQIVDSVNEDWNINLETGVAETKEKVKLGVKYNFPQEEKVSVTFKCLPEEGTTQLKIQKVKISDLKLPEVTNSYGEYAYDITTGMSDGTFEYDVTLPKPENSTAEISYIEKSLDDAKNNEIKADEIKLVEESKTEQQNETVTATSLDHFTIFIPVLRTDVLKIMPLGDSLTKGSRVCYAPDTYLNCTGYRIHLWNMLVENGFDNFDFVGSQGGIFQSQYTHDNDHEGHGGWTSASIEASIYGWLETYQPDIILLHIGTNDLSSGDVEDILEKIDDYENNKAVDVDVILALIVNRKNGGHTATSNFNDAIETMALARIAAGDNLKILDMENGAGINYVSDMLDDKHPNDSGYQKMAAAWYNALTNESVDPSCSAGIQPISSITATGVSGPNPIMLESVTVGAGCYTINVENLYTGTGSGTGGSPTYPVQNADNFNINNFANTLNPHDIVLFNGDLWVDTNGNNPDFFIFENGGTDDGTIAAIFPDGSFGNPISFNGNSHWGDTGFNSSVGSQDIKGISFAITDLLDGSGNHLTNDTIIKGLRIVSGGLDPSSVSAVIVGESQLPCTNTVSGLGTITATGNAGVIQTISYGGNTYNTGDLDLGLTKQYLADGTEVPLSPDYLPGADVFSFNRNAHTTDNAIYLQTMFAEDHDTFFVFENGGNDDANWYGVRADGTLTSGFFVDASVVAVATGYKSGFGGDLKGFVFITCEDVRGIRIEDNPSTFGFDAQSISAVPLEDDPPAEQVCPDDGDWDKVDGLSSLSYTYTAASGKLVAETCYKAGTSVVYGNVDPAISPVTVSSTVWNKDGCPDAAGCNYQDLSHASFRLVDAPLTGSIEVTKVVDWGNNDPDTTQSFDICVTNDSDTWTDCKDVDYDGGTVMWDLDPMTYSVYERDPGSNWVVSGGIPVDVSVTAGGNSTVTITNTYNPVFRPLCETPTIINFNDLQTGELVTNQYNHFGLTISAHNNNPSHPNKAIIFDSANPTGNDPDLVTPGYGPGNLLSQGKILIIAQDDLDIFSPIGFVDNPNDEAAGGIFYFNFAIPTDINGIGLLDIEENGGEIRLYDEADSLTDTIFFYSRGDNSYQSVNILKSNVKRMEVELVGSGAITHQSLCPVPQFGSISGTKWEDMDGDLSTTDDLSAISDWTIRLYECTNNFNNCFLEDTTQTDNSGYYIFENLLPGLYKIMESLPDGWTNILPTAIDEELTAGEDSNGNNFINFENVSVTACKESDSDGLIATTNGRFPVDGWEVSLIKDSVVIDTQLTDVPQRDGCYTWNDLGPGDYSVSEETKTGWQNLNPTTHNFGVVQSGDNYSHKFINTHLGTMIVKKVMIGGTDSFDFTGDVSGTISTNDGTLTVNNVVPGDYTSVELPKTGWDLTNISCDDGSSQSPSDPDLSTGQLVFKIDPGETVTCTFSNTKLSSISGVKWQDMNGDGIKDAEDLPISGWTINLDKNADGSLDQTIVTDASGNYTFSNLLPGTYKVIESTPYPWNVSFPSPGVNYYTAINLAAGANLIEYDFGNYKNGEIKGYKWEDIDGDGIKDGGEGAPNSQWQIKLWKEVNGVPIDQGISASTDPTTGSFTFGVPLGTYYLSEVLQSGWAQTWPDGSLLAPDGITRLQGPIVVTSGSISENNNFGNVQTGSIKIIKDVVPNDESLWNFTVTGNGGPYNVTDLGDGDSYTIDGLVPGSYNISETTDAAYSTTVTCGQIGPLNLNGFLGTVVAGVTLECTFVNTYRHVCGDGIINDGEECDYGELNGDSICSSECTLIRACLPEMVANGDFEIPNSNDPLGWDIFTNAEVPGWTAEWHGGSGGDNDPQIELHAGVNGWTSSDDQYAELDSDWDGPGGSLNGEAASISIYQSIPVIAGYEYRVSWSYSPRPNHNDNRLKVEVDGDSVFDSGVMVGGGSVNWQDESRTFVPDSDSVIQIRFTETGNPDSYGMFLDNVSVECLGPEILPVCGDGERNQEIEECDGTDGVTPGQNFCTSTCKLVPIYDGQHSCPVGVPVKITENPLVLSSTSGTPIQYSFEGGKKYLLEAFGTYSYNKNSVGNLADPAYGTNTNWSNVRSDIGIWGTKRGVTSILGDLGLGMGVIEWDDDSLVNGDHFYRKAFSPSSDVTADFVISDWYGDWYESAYDNQGGMGDNQGNLHLDVYECQEVSTVTVCKYDNLQNPLSNWNVSLKGDLVDTVDVLPNGSDYNSGVLAEDDYVLEANGYYTYRPGTPGAEYTDANYSKRHPDDAVYGGSYVPWVNVNSFPAPHTGWLGVMINGSPTDWSDYFNPDHIYTLGYQDYTGSFSFKILDDYYGDNSGKILVGIYKGYAGTTGENGCVTFENVPFGTYFVDEVLKDGWNYLSGRGNVIVDVLVEEFTLVNERIYGSISGYKYEDINGNGQKDDNEGLLSGWEIELRSDDESQVIDTTTTDVDGNYSFSSVTPGDYQVCEINKSGWFVTQPWAGLTSGTVCQPVSITAGQTASAIFGNFETVDVGGYKFEDIDDSQTATPDDGEPYLDGWVIKLYRQIFDDADQAYWDFVGSHPTGPSLGYATGQYGWGVGPGTYRICELIGDHEGWTQTFPNASSGGVVKDPANTDEGPFCHQFTVSSGTDIPGLNFGNRRNPVTIKAYKVVCDSEVDLPDMSGGANINATTAQTIVENSNGKCRYGDGWDFQWGFANKASVAGVDKLTGTHVGPADGTPSSCSANCGSNTNTGIDYKDWKTFGSTSSNNYGMTEVTINDLEDAPGIWVRENLQANYVPFSYPPQASPGSNVSAEMYCHNDVEKFDNYDQIVSPQYGQTYYCVAFNALNLGSFAGKKYIDDNMNGQMDGLESTVAGWKIELYKHDGTNYVYLTETTTDGAGNYVFENLLPGMYKISEDLSTGEYRATDPNDSGHYNAVNLGAGQNLTGFDFGNFKLGAIQGRKYQDNDFDGTRQAGEPWLGGWTVNLYDSSWTNVGAVVTDDITGLYRFENLTKDTYYTCEVMQDDWKQTGPLDLNANQVVNASPNSVNEGPVCWRSVINKSGQERTGRQFGNVSTYAIHGYKWNDTNTNGQRDDEPLMSGWEIFIDQNGNQQWDEGEPKTTTSSNDDDHFGWYWFEGLYAGTYSICEVGKLGWAQTYPLNPTCHAVTLPDLNPRALAVSENMVVGPEYNFGNVQLGEIEGYKWEDTNRNGQRDCDDPQSESCEPMVGAWLMFIDENSNGQHDAGEPAFGTNDNDPNYYGYYRFPNLMPGDYTVCEEEKSGWARTYPSDSNCQQAQVLAGQKTAGINFGNTQYGDVLVYKYEDLNSNGEYDEGEPLLPDWNMVLGQGDTADLTQTTGSSGSTLFRVVSGAYDLSEEMQPGWIQSGITCEGSEGGVKITSDNEAYGHHGACSGWNACGNAETCALWACEVNGYTNLVSYGQAKPCTEFESLGGKCHLFHNRGSVQWDWSKSYGGGCPVMGVTDIVCSNALPSASPTPTPIPGQESSLLQRMFGISEVMAQSASDNSYHLNVLPGDRKTCYVGNFRPGKIEGYKYNDINDNGVLDQGETGLENWEMCLGEGNCVLTDVDGFYQFTGLSAGSYTVTEEDKSTEGWRASNPESGQHQVEIFSGSTEQRDFYNAPPASILLVKSNNRPSASVGDIVTYSLNITVGQRTLSEMTLVDNLPEGFVYQAGSATVSGGTIVSVEPTLSNSDKTLTWTWGEVLAGSIITVTYQTRIDSANQAASYTNFAYVHGSGSPTEVETDIVDSVVRIDPTVSVSTSVGGEVLGASTELPASGSSTWYLILALSLIGTGLVIKKNKRLNL